VRWPWERSEGKVQAWHRDRLAAVYVRQSTAAQVVDHQESTRLQYGLAERAVALGWAAARVLVIDEDLGHSASGADARPGFQRLVSEVGLDHVGIVLGIEMSRLARSGREWHQLLKLCALSGALLGDMDGIYDPAEHNDRMLLGLKGTISEMLCRIRHKISYADLRIMPRCHLADRVCAAHESSECPPSRHNPDASIRLLPGGTCVPILAPGRVPAGQKVLQSPAQSWRS
jgi:hypothetical protein